MAFNIVVNDKIFHKNSISLASNLSSSHFSSIEIRMPPIHSIFTSVLPVLVATILLDSSFLYHANAESTMLNKDNNKSHRETFQSTTETINQTAVVEEILIDFGYSLDNLCTECDVIFDSDNSTEVATQLILNNVGTISTKIGLLTQLQILQLSSVVGTIPTEIGNLAELQTLYILSSRSTSDSLMGSIPTEIGKLYKLQKLQIFNTDINGPIPIEFANLTNLEELWLSNNPLLGGTIPAELSNLKKLHFLLLAQCSLTGTIPTQVGEMTNLDYFRASFNELTGAVPSEVGLLTNLTRLYLNNNDLTGTVPLEMANLSHIEILVLRENDLTGDMNHLCGVQDGGILSFDRDKMSICCSRFCRIDQITLEVVATINRLFLGLYLYILWPLSICLLNFPWI